MEQRIEAALRLLPLPEELSDSSAVAAQPQVQELIRGLYQAGTAIYISGHRKDEL